MLSSVQHGALILIWTCILSWFILRAQSYGVSPSRNEDPKSKLVSLSNPSSVLLMARETAAASGIFLFAFMCEYFPIFASTERTWNADDFAFLALLFFGVTAGSVTKVKDASMLNRLQTDEWKGWMQWLFIMYHYYAASSIYNCIRVFICAYVWMTGYGNFIYFTTAGNYRPGRFIHMMWRLNFAVLMLMLVMNKSWMVYYICPLHTFYFVLTFLVCFFYKSGNGSDLFLRSKILATFIIIAIVWDAASGYIFNILWTPFLSSEEGSGGTRGGTLWEWYFRTSLDKYACAFGMLAGLNREKLAELLGGNRDTYRPRLALIAISIAYVAWWCHRCLQQPKHDYNKENAYVAPGVVMAFVILRNSTALFRQYYFAFPAHLGRISLESYLLQYHIWLTCSATRLMVLVPGLPKVNLLVTSVVFLTAANQLYEKTASLKVLLFSEDDSQCVATVCKMMLGLLSLCTLGVVVSTIQAPIAALGASFIISLLLAVGVSHAVKRGTASAQHAQQTESVPQIFEVDAEVGQSIPGEPKVRVWVGAAVGLWALVYVGMWVSGISQRNEEERPPVFRAPAGQYSNLQLGGSICVVSAVLLMVTARTATTDSPTAQCE